MIYWDRILNIVLAYPRKLKNTSSAALLGIPLGICTFAALALLNWTLKFLAPPSAIVAQSIDTQAYIQIFFGGILLAPALETAIFQVMPFELTQFRERSFPCLSLGISTLAFSAAHLIISRAHAEQMLFLGLMFGTIYLWVRRRSRKFAFYTTAIAHTTYNLVALILLLFFPQLA